MGDNIVTRVERQKRNPRRVSIYINDEFAFGAPESVVETFRLVRGLVLSDEDLERLKIEAQREEAFSRACRYLSRRLRTEEEIRVKLREEAYPSVVIESTLERLRRLRYLDDRNYAEAFVRDRSRFRPKGRSALADELRRKGIQEEVIRRVLDDLVSESEELRLARDAAARYLPRLLRVSPHRKKITRMISFLLRRGFPSRVARDIAEELLESGEE